MPSNIRSETKTKIIATIGPASREQDVLRALLDAGLDVCRINFSHGETGDHAAALANIRAVAQQSLRPITVMGDLCGPKIRLGSFEREPVTISPGQTIHVEPGQGPCSERVLTVNYNDLISQVRAGHRILIDDGLVRLRATSKTEGALECVCEVGGRLSSHKGVNLPDTPLDLPALTEKDIRDLHWAIDNDLDYVALSFVRRPDDLYQLKSILKQRGSALRVIVKIEKPEALAHIDELIENADGLLVARGDLGVEMDLWQVPIIQKDLVQRCSVAAIPVIVATQMLQSMVDSPTPTRAEVSDVANAIFDRADAVMLSAETAVGKYPVLAVDVMNRIAVTTERHIENTHAPSPLDAMAHQPFAHPPSDPSAFAAANYLPGAGGLPITSAITSAAARAAMQLGARLVAVRTASGNSARLLSRQRLPMPIIGLTWDERVARRISLHYGVIPIHMEPLTEPETLFASLDAELLRLKLCDRNDVVIVVTATQPARAGGTNAVFVHVVGRGSAPSPVTPIADAIA